MAVAAQDTGNRSAAGVTAELVYLADRSIPPTIYYTEPGLPRRVGNYGRFAAHIADMHATKGLSLDREGFELHRFEPDVADFYDVEGVEKDYYSLVSDLVKAVTDATEAIVFDHTIRTEGGGTEDSTVLRAPVRLVHNDYTEGSAPKRVRELLPDDEAERWLAGRFIELNVWRPLEGPVQVAPLAVSDARSISASDLTLVNMYYPDRMGEIYHALFNPDHRWYYVPQMMPDEAILIKGYDSAKDGRARFTLHTAFDDPQTPENPPPRKSIEARVLALMTD